MNQARLSPLMGLVILLSGRMLMAQIVPEGQFISFNGIDQNLTIQDHPDFNIAAGESYTITCRVKPENFDADYCILSKGNLYVPGGKYALLTHKASTTPNFGFSLHNSDNTNLGTPFMTNLEAGKWVHLAWVYQANQKSSRIFINGVLFATVNNQAIGRQKVLNPDNLLLGCAVSDPDHPVKTMFWPGQADELRIWKRALTGQEVLDDISAKKANLTGLVASYDFESINGNMVPDVSGKGHHARLHGFEIRVLPTSLPAGTGATNERLIGFRINASSGSETLKSIKVDLSGTDAISDIASLKLYHNGSSGRLNLQTARLYGTLIPVMAKTLFSCDIPLKAGENFIWITADISSSAPEGNVLQAKVLSITKGDGTMIALRDESSKRIILITNKLLFSGGDGGSKHYRIPAIVTARDGSLVTATDRRWDSTFDLPAHIDVVVRRSTDLGRSWSSPLTIAGETTGAGFGDPALVVNRKNGEIICLFASDRGFFSSTSAFPIRIYQAVSADNGQSWSLPQDITNQIYGTGCPNPLSRNWHGAFVTSGSATQLKNGRLMAVMPVRENVTRAISNYVIYSDDNARTWKVAPAIAATGGGEAKLVELENGNILMSIRNQGTRMFSLSKDKGMTWSSPFPETEIMDPSCNGDMIRYTSVSRGFMKNRILHSIPFSTSRLNVSVLMSYDEGNTWPVRKTIYSGPSAYSSLTILPDGTIGLYYEVGEYEIYEMYFASFSLNWLTNGADRLSDKRHNFISSTSGADMEEKLPEFRAYPNPAQGFVNISGQFKPDIPVELYDLRGFLIRQVWVDHPQDQLRMSLDGLPAGFYFIKIGETTLKLAVR